MSYTKDEVMGFIQGNDVKFIRLVFCDIFGAPKNVSVMAEYLPHVFEVGSGFDVSAVDGFMNIEEGDLVLYPAPQSLAVLPWRPTDGRVARMYCDIKHVNGAPFEGDGRQILRAAVQDALSMGLAVKARTECEFYLFDTDEQGAPTLRPHDNAGYLDIAPLDRCENVRREVCLALEAMGMAPMGSHHEKGPGQNEIWCRATDVLGCADDFITYKTVVRTIAAQNGLFACFMPKPLEDKSGSGLHINMSLHAAEDGRQDKIPPKTFHSFTAGILERIAEMTLFLNTTTNSYRRFGSFEAPAHISWAQGNRSQLVRVPFGPRDSTRMELRSPDPLCNPYIAFALLLRAGMEGIQNRASLPLAALQNLNTLAPGAQSQFSLLPQNLGEAIQAAESSAFVSSCLPSSIISKTIDVKRVEWERFIHTDDKRRFEHEYYFGHI